MEVLVLLKRESVLNANAFIAGLEGHVEEDEYKYLDTPIVFYYNPVMGKKCDDYVGANSTDGVKS